MRVRPRRWRQKARPTALTLVAATVAVLSAAGPGAAADLGERGFELVSPPDKSGGEVMTSSGRTRAAFDGSAVNFASLTAFADARGTGVATEYVAQRATSPAPGSSGWSTHSITPQHESQTFVTGIAAAEPHYPGAFSSDLTRAVFRSWSPLTDAPDVAEVLNLYLRPDVLTPGAGTYLLTSPCPLCVTPFGPESRGPVPTFAGASSDFEHLIFESTLSLAPGAAGEGPKLYEWDRGLLRLAGVLPDGSGAERSIAGRGVNVGNFLRSTSRPLSQDGSRVVFTVGAFDDAVSGAIYMRIAGRTSIRLNTSERTVPDTEQEATYWDASIDHSRVFFTSPEALTDDAPATGEDQLYMWSRQPSNERQSVTVSATGGTYALTLGGQTTAPIPFDASAATVQAALETLPTIGTGNVSVAGGPGNAAGSGPYAVAFGGDLAGVNVQELQTDPSLLTGGSSSAAVATASPVENLTYLNVDEEPADTSNAVQGVLGTSEDGRYVYFVAIGQLVPGKATLDADFGLYLWHDGTIRYVGELAGFPEDRNELVDGVFITLAVKQTDVTPDGHYLLFGTGAGAGLLSAHGGVDSHHGDCGRGGLSECREVYVYSADDDNLVCASCNPTGAPATANASVRVREGIGGTVVTNYISRVLSDDGRYTFFTTREALVPGDTNNREDAYVYDLRAGRAALLSSGTHPSDSYFLDASADGRDAFFATRERLVGWDVDQAYDLYDARVDGGFPEPVAPPPVCTGDPCQGLPGLAPGALGIGSSALLGTTGDFKPRLARRQGRRCKRGKVRKRVRGKVRCVARRGSPARGTRGRRDTSTRRAK